MLSEIGEYSFSFFYKSHLFLSLPESFTIDFMILFLPLSYFNFQYNLKNFSIFLSNFTTIILLIIIIFRIRRLLLRRKEENCGLEEFQ